MDALEMADKFKEELEAFAIDLEIYQNAYNKQISSEK